MSDRIPSLDMADERISPSGRLITAKREVHRMRKAPEYNSWVGMKNRCLNPNQRGYADYGGRGITICEPWLRSFMAFYRDMGPRPGPSYSIDRIDNARGYEPGNCRWALPDVQSQNRRRCFLTVDGVRRPIRDWARDAGISVETIRRRLVKGALPKEAVKPAMPRGERNNDWFKKRRASAERAGIKRTS